MKRVDRDRVVALHYTLHSAAGRVLDSTREDEPIEFLQGAGEIIPGLERAIQGMKVGEEREVVLEAEEAYGPRDPEARVRVPRSAFPPEFDLRPGAAVGLRGEDDEDLTAYVQEIGEGEVVLDLNHPLAGQRLRFRLQVVGVRRATEEELRHGHAHGEGSAGH